MNSKSGYNGAYFQEIYNKQNDSRRLMIRLAVKHIHRYVFK